MTCPRFFHLLDAGIRSARPAAQPFGDKRDDQGVQAHPFLLRVCGESGVQALRDPLDPLPAQSRRGGRDRVLELLCGGQPGAQCVRAVLHRFLDRPTAGDAPGEVGELHQPPSALGFGKAADREGVLDLFHLNLQSFGFFRILPRILAAAAMEN